MDECIKNLKNMFLLLVLIVILCSVNNNGVVFAYPKEDIVVKLPGQPEVGFKQFAGYVDVDEKAGRSFFYYFVEAEQNAPQLPLTLWLNGGPGCSSIGGGAFTELGPFFPRGDGRGLRPNKQSWNKVSNLLFVEAPAGVGFSYSNTSTDYTCGDDSTARDMVTFMLKWLEKFPSFKSRPLFLTGESYAGHYIPQLAIGMLNYNKHSKNFKFNIKGMALGNPLLRVETDVPAVYEFFWSHGLISDEVYDSITNECNFDDYVFPYPHNVTNSCNIALYQANRIVGDYINVYDVLLDVCYPSIVQQELRLRKLATKMSVGVDVCMTAERRFYLNLPQVQRALHANRTNLPYPWTTCTDMLKYNQEDSDRDMLPLLVDIVKHKIPLWIYSGDQDSVVPLIGSRTLVRELAHEFNFKITAPYGAWFHKGQNMPAILAGECLLRDLNQKPLLEKLWTDTDVLDAFGTINATIVGGWQVEYGNILTFATVRGAAHMVPYAQPARALSLFSSFVKGQRLPNTTTPQIGGPPIE